MKLDHIFLDENVLFLAAYREQSGLLRLWQLKSVRLISSAYAIEEARRNLGHDIQKERLEALLLKVKIVPECIHQQLPEKVSIKEKDKPILLAAIAAGVDYLITGDMKDFGQFYGKQIEGVIILPPSEYLNNYTKSHT